MLQKAFKELLLSLVALQKCTNDDEKALFKMLLNNVCYIHEYRETVFQMMTSYNENHNTKWENSTENYSFDGTMIKTLKLKSFLFFK